MGTTLTDPVTNNLLSILLEKIMSYYVNPDPTQQAEIIASEKALLNQLGQAIEPTPRGTQDENVYTILRALSLRLDALEARVP